MTTAPSSGKVALRLSAALVAFAAGVGAIVTVSLLAHSTLTAAGSSSSSAAAAPAAGDGGSSGSSAFPAPPPGSLTLAREDRDLAVALSASSGPGRLSLQASVVGQEGPAAGLDVSFRLDGRRVIAARACGTGCYEAAVAGGPRPGTVAIDLRGPDRPASTVSFAFPVDAPSGAAIVRRATATWRRLRTLVVHDRLSAGPGSVVRTVWRFQTPDRLSYRVSTGPEAVIVGGRRWDRETAHGPWLASALDPIRQPVPLWASVSNARIVGKGTLRARPVWRVAFFDPQLDAWFTIAVDRQTLRTLDLRMTAQAHFMHQVYGPFDSPLSIEPPARRRP